MLPGKDVGVPTGKWGVAPEKEGLDGGGREVGGAVLAQGWKRTAKELSCGGGHWGMGRTRTVCIGMVWSTSLEVREIPDPGYAGSHPSPSPHSTPDRQPG